MNRLNKLYNKSPKIKINSQDKIVIMSDCHRGLGGTADNFNKNRNIFLGALDYYYKNNFTYIELGDGDELWETNSYQDIIEQYLPVFESLKKFHDEKRFIMIYGNHDIYKRKTKYVKNNLYEYKKKKLLNDLTTYESIILEYEEKNIFLIHGHQMDLLNGKLWLISRFLVRHLWRPLENIGLKDLTGPAKNYQVSKTIEKKFRKWSLQKQNMLITGHTHRPIYPKVGESLYFNDGSCIHSNGITCLEIASRNISLVKWIFTLNESNLITIKKEIVAGPEAILSFY